ncbi:hypothetical protein NH340_JMT05760 [Sarcoptes scabiei]|nr:hypothetical protein NH340_JMT05760 [Sarcoptes scabiei]
MLQSDRLKTWCNNLFPAPMAEDETLSNSNDLDTNHRNNSTIVNTGHFQNSGTDFIDMNSINQSGQILNRIDPNMYATRKTIAQGIMGIGLMCANASQLKCN